MYTRYMLIDSTQILTISRGIFNYVLIPLLYFVKDYVINNKLERYSKLVSTIFSRREN